MREKQQKQMPLMEPESSHPQQRELEAISNIIDNTPTISEYVLQDLNRGRIIKRRTGARGMSADVCGVFAVLALPIRDSKNRLSMQISNPYRSRPGR